MIDARVLIVVLAALAAGIVGLGIWLSRRARARRRAAEAELLARLGGRLVEDATRRSVIEALVEDRAVRLVRVETSKSLTTRFEVQAPARDFGFDIQPRRSVFVATLGPTLVVTGDAGFDEQVLAMSPERERLAGILTPELRRLLVEQAGREAAFWWRLKDGVLRGEIRGSWGSSGFQERCDRALAIATGLASAIERAG